MDKQPVEMNFSERVQELSSPKDLSGLHSQIVTETAGGLMSLVEEYKAAIETGDTIKTKEIDERSTEITTDMREKSTTVMERIAEVFPTAEKAVQASYEFQESDEQRRFLVLWANAIAKAGESESRY